MCASMRKRLRLLLCLRNSFVGISIQEAKMSGVKEKQTQFTVLVEGNIGSGKTTFLNHFANDDALVLSEPVERWRNLRGHNLLGLLYENPTRWAHVFQSYVQLTMLDFHMQRSNHRLKLMERSIHSARYCFVENLKNNGNLADAEYAVLDEWFKWLMSRVDLRCDLIVYLRTDPKVVHKRIVSRGRKEEANISLEYLEKLHQLHEKWLYERSAFSCPAPVKVLDANQDIKKIKENFQKCRSEIYNDIFINERSSPVIQSTT
ncbi:deoxynucleoside kinase-like [Schistocerca serialis cubense]|uniref:deoxynucleoside kinase-like n=1 Tax=Schistocerca serialis cubense TaxID=2023355 RepID=UPI00214EA021|nr:deoxynucleoside kinase-like [Schistocerca serialis cubense]